MEDIYSIFEKPKNPTEFRAIRIKLASPEKIKAWSYGEVKKPETINYRTFKPERDGLFCAKIFGPVNDWECICGKYKRMKHRGVVCDKCGVEVIQAKARRERLGHIDLAAPVSHIWFFKSRPSIIGSLLDMTMRQLEKVIYFESYIVVDPGETKLKAKELLTDEEYRKNVQEYGDKFKAGVGAEAIKELLRMVDLDELSKRLRQGIRQTRSDTTKAKIAKRLRVVEAFRGSGNKPEWMIMDVIPVLPPDLRPLVPLEGGRFATSDLNDLYRRVINMNNRLKRLMELNAPSVIIRNEKRMLQEAVDALLDNGRRSRVIKVTSKRQLNSLSDMIKGKQGRFRQNLLGKRVDYSGRSVVVVGPDLKLHQCGLPKTMALELFKPYIFSKLEKKGYVTTIKAAKKIVERGEEIIWDCLDEVIREHPVLLNRAPTLHRLGMQAFYPVLVDGKAIRLHPLVCKAFNADFDGDQMAVHVPLSIEAQIEARVLMMSVNNILSPASGEPIITPTQDIILGIYYLTKENPGTPNREIVFADLHEVRIAYDAGVIDIHAGIKVRMNGEIIETITGRILLMEILPCGFPFSLVNKTIKKDDLQNIIKYLFGAFGKQDTVEFLNKLVNFGFQYATESGVSVCMDDMIVPITKQSIIDDAQKRQMQYYEIPDIDEDSETLMSSGERKNMVIDLWSNVSKLIANEVKNEFQKADNSFNSIYMIIDSGARCSSEHLIYLGGMKGLVADPTGEIIPYAITSNLREGLTPFQYFISTYSTRKGLADTALKTANSGYLTRRLVDVIQDIVITEHDCGTSDGIFVSAIVLNNVSILPLEDRIKGRFSAEEALHPLTSEIVLMPGEEITEVATRKILQAKIKKVKIRSVITCQTRKGVCARCYGDDLSKGEIANIGEAVGIIAAQSIGEPGTQLTMNSRHFLGGIQIGLPRIAELFEARQPKDKSSADIRRILEEAGLREAQLVLLNELQKCYKVEKVAIHDKHFELVIRKMTEKIKIEDPADTLFLRGENVHRQIFVEENTQVQFEGEKPATGKPILMGITKASLSTDSWISAASFQETTRVLTGAAISGAVDELKGLKENVIIGSLIPAGTGMPRYKDTFVKSEFKEADENL